MRLALEDYDGGISVGGRTINNLRYADDTTLLAGSASELENLIERVRVKKQDKGDDCQPTGREPIYSCRKSIDRNNQSVQLSGVHDIKPG